MAKVSRAWARVLSSSTSAGSARAAPARARRPPHRPAGAGQCAMRRPTAPSHSCAWAMSVSIRPSSPGSPSPRRRTRRAACRAPPHLKLELLPVAKLQPARGRVAQHHGAGRKPVARAGGGRQRRARAPGAGCGKLGARKRVDADELQQLIPHLDVAADEGRAASAPPPAHRGPPRAAARTAPRRCRAGRRAAGAWRRRSPPASDSSKARRELAVAMSTATMVPTPRVSPRSASASCAGWRSRCRRLAACSSFTAPRPPRAAGRRAARAPDPRGARARRRASR